MTFIEGPCAIEHEGKTFEAGGAWLRDGRGVVYVDVSPSPTRQHRVTDWHGKVLAAAELGPIYWGNYCRMRSVRFDYEGAAYVGRYCPDAGDAVRVRALKKKEEES
jgi:hypothetical protein